MSKKQTTSNKLYVGKPKTDLTVGVGKYKTKTLLWVAKNDFEFFLQIEELYYKDYPLNKQKYYNEVKKRFTQNHGFLTTESVHEKVHEVVKLMKEKKTVGEIREQLSSSIQSPVVLDRILTDANFLIRKEFELQKESLVDTHLLRYEQAFFDNMNPKVDHVAPGYRKAIIAESYMTAMDTLFQKERLLGIHTKKFKIRASNLSIKQQTGNVDYNIGLLSFNEQLELFDLLRKAKTTEQLIRPITNDNPLNIDIKQYKEVEVVYEAPVRQIEETDVIGDKHQLIEKNKGKNLQEIQESINATLRNKIEEAFKKTKK